MNGGTEKRWSRSVRPTTRTILLLLLPAIVCVAAVAGCRHLPSDESSPTDVVERSLCWLGGGRWEVLGFSGIGCNWPTSDAGKPCTDSSQCESWCFARRLGGFENPTGEFFPAEPWGSCSPWKANVGCHVAVEQGQHLTVCID